MAEVAEQVGVASNGPVAVFKKRTAKSKTNIRKRPATPPPASDSSSEYSSEDEAGQKIKRRRKNGVAVTQTAPRRFDGDSLEATKFTGSSSNTIDVSNDATRQSNWYDENADDALSAKQLLGSSLAPKKDERDDKDDGMYKGSANYSNFIQKNPNAPSRSVGPVKAPTNIRTITITDYAPDVCKDYKQTGFCGFGDNCKYLHERTDYKSGWELDRDWDISTKGKKVSGKAVASANRNTTATETDDDAEEAMLENIPFACFICKEPYKSPIITKCGHYFCEKCALDRYRKHPSCAACGSGTSGVFNVAKNLKKLLEKKTERAKQRKAKAREAGEEVSSDDDDEDDEDEPTATIP